MASAQNTAWCIIYGGKKYCNYQWFRCLNRTGRLENTNYNCKSRQDYITAGDHASHVICGPSMYEQRYVKIRLGKKKIIMYLAVTETRGFRVY